MTNEQTMTLVLKDATGSYFLVPQTVLEQGRVPEEQKAEVERLIAEAAQADTAGDDTQGYFLPLIGVAVFAVGFGVGAAAVLEGKGAGDGAGYIGQQAADLGNALKTVSDRLGRQ